MKKEGYYEWERERGYLGPADATAVLADVDWRQTRAYGLGINGLYINLQGRERDGIVSPGEEKEKLIEELKTKLEGVKDVDGRRVIRHVTERTRYIKARQQDQHRI